MYVELLPRVGYICRNGYATSIFSGEVHLRVQEHEGIGNGSLVSRSHVTFVTPAHLMLCLLVVFVWGVVLRGFVCFVFAFYISGEL